MTLSQVVAALAAVVATGVGGAAVVRKRDVTASWFFFIGILLLAAEAVFASRMANWGTDAFAAGVVVLLWFKSLLPGVWLTFSLLYCRGNGWVFVRLWRWWLGAGFLVPPGIAIAGADQLVTLQGGAVLLLPAAKVLLVTVLLGVLAVIFNIEKTFRASIGVARWRIKFLFLGVALVFGVQLYALSQFLLFTEYDPRLAGVEAIGLLVGSGLMTVGYLRHGFRDIDIYPSRSVLQGSLTLILSGVYLLFVGLLAEGTRWLGRGAGFPSQALVILLGVTGLGILMVSDRARVLIQRLVSRHFSRPEYDFRAVWTEFAQQTSSLMDSTELCARVARMTSSTFSVLNVAVYLEEEGAAVFKRVASTADMAGARRQPDRVDLGSAAEAAILDSGEPFDLDRIDSDWAGPLKESCVSTFDNGGHRYVVPIVCDDRLAGLMLLADRVSGIPYSVEELELLGCLGDQLAVALMNRSLTEEVVRGRELEAFQTMSTFFVHDLKNSANSLSLMLRNLPRHFDDPEFREDALRGIGRTVERINGLVKKLGTIRRELDLRPTPTDLNELVREVMGSLGGQLPFKEVVEDLRPLPTVNLDREHMRSVLSNLVINAGEAVNGDGRLSLATEASDDRIVFTVSDNGCGIDPVFLRESLFRPFRTTKSSGLGIGMFQCKRIVEAHHGTIHAESQPGIGTTFRITLPQTSENADS